MTTRTDLRSLSAFAFTLIVACPSAGAAVAANDESQTLDWVAIRAAHAEWKHTVVADGSIHRARNEAQALDVTFDGRGVSIVAEGRADTFALEFVSFGREGARSTVDEPLAVHTSGRRLEYTWTEHVAEWYVNHDLGLEHGFTLFERPAGDGTLSLELASVGGLEVRVDASTTSCSVVDAQGQRVLGYSNLIAFDRDHDAVAAWIEPRANGGFAIVVDDSAADYPLTIDPITQQAYIKASNTGSDFFGHSMALSGKTLVVGAPWESSAATMVNGNQTSNAAPQSGAAYVFVHDGTTWVQQAYLKPFNTDSSDEFGESVSISGNTIVVGAPYEASIGTGAGANPSDDSAPDAGAAYVFVRNGSTWTQQAYLKASNTDAGDFFGADVAVFRDTIVVGASGEDSDSVGVNSFQFNNDMFAAGAAYVFVRVGTVWTQQAYIKAPDVDSIDSFGLAVAAHEDVIAIASPRFDSGATGINGDVFDESSFDSGAVFVYRRTGSTWALEAFVKASNTGAVDGFGESLALTSDLLVVGAPSEDSAATGIDGDQSSNAKSFAGAAYFFERVNGQWAQTAYVKASNSDGADQFGWSIDAHGDVVVVGADREFSNANGVNGDQDDDSAPSAGAAYTFERNGGTWAQTAYLKASNSNGGDRFGTSVAVWDDLVVVGAPNEESSATGIGGLQSDNSVAGAGAAYGYDLDRNWIVLHGCGSNPASWITPSVPARVGQSVDVELVSPSVVNGTAFAFYGAKRIDSVGCGVMGANDYETFLLSMPAPVLFSITATSASSTNVPVAVPNVAALSGLRLVLQAAVVDANGIDVDVSKGLELEIRP